MLDGDYFFLNDTKVLIKKIYISLSLSVLGLGTLFAQRASSIASRCVESRCRVPSSRGPIIVVRPSHRVIAPRRCAASLRRRRRAANTSRHRIVALSRHICRAALSCRRRAVSLRCCHGVVVAPLHRHAAVFAALSLRRHCAVVASSRRRRCDIVAPLSRRRAASSCRRHGCRAIVALSRHRCRAASSRHRPASSRRIIAAVIDVLLLHCCRGVVKSSRCRAIVVAPRHHVIAPHRRVVANRPTVFGWLLCFASRHRVASTVVAPLSRRRFWLVVVLLLCC